MALNPDTDSYEVIDEFSAIYIRTEKEVHEIRKKEKVSNKKLDAREFCRSAKPYCIKYLISNYGKSESKIYSDINNSILKEINSFVSEQICKKLHGTIFEGQIIPCGSVGEGLKVGLYDEFDFIYELSTQGSICKKLLPNKTKPSTFRAPQKSDKGEHSYFSLAIREGAPVDWEPFMNCKLCAASLTPVRCQLDHPDRSLHSPSVQMAFRKAILDTLDSTNTRSDTTVQHGIINADEPDENSPLLPSISYRSYEIEESGNNADSIKIDKNGPATTIYVSSCIQGAPPLIKIDITLAFRVPCDVLIEHGLVLDDGIHLDNPLRSCHLIATGDHWRASFVQWETETMRRLTKDEVKRSCYRALKNIRDENSVTGSNESKLLPTYPLKVSFLKEQKTAQIWLRDTLDDHVIRILARVVIEGNEGGQTSYYIKDDLVDPGNRNHSYWDALRLLDKLENDVKVYGKLGRRHALLVGFILLFMLFQLFMILASLWLFSPLEITFYCFSIVLSSCGIGFIRENKGRNNLYPLMQMTQVFYILILLKSMACLLIAFICKESEMNLRVFKYLTFIPVILVLIHCIILLIFGKERCRRYHYPDRGCCYRRFFCCEFVFFGPLYKEVFCSRCSSRDAANTTDIEYI